MTVISISQKRCTPLGNLITVFSISQKACEQSGRTTSPIEQWSRALAPTPSRGGLVLALLA